MTKNIASACPNLRTNFLKEFLVRHKLKLLFHKVNAYVIYSLFTDNQEYSKELTPFSFLMFILFISHSELTKNLASVPFAPLILPFFCTMHLKVFNLLLIYLFI